MHMVLSSSPFCVIHIHNMYVCTLCIYKYLLTCMSIIDKQMKFRVIYLFLFFWYMVTIG